VLPREMCRRVGFLGNRAIWLGDCSANEPGEPRRDLTTHITHQTVKTRSTKSKARLTSVFSSGLHQEPFPHKLHCIALDSNLKRNGAEKTQGPEEERFGLSC
jgi:hypothetical protein